MSKREQYSDTKDVITAKNGTNSASFQIPRWANFVGVYCPNLDVGAVTLHVSKDDSTFIPVGDVTDGDDYAVVKSGSDPCYTDISEIVAGVTGDWFFQLVSASQTTAAVTYTICFRA